MGARFQTWKLDIEDTVLVKPCLKEIGLIHDFKTNEILLPGSHHALHACILYYISYIICQTLVIASLSILSTFKICFASSNDIPIILLVVAVFAPCFAVFAAL